MDHRLTFPPRSSVLSKLRPRVRDLACQMGAPTEVGERLALVVDELVNNAVEHGAAYRRRGLDLAIELHVVAEGTQISFFDQEMPVDSVRELARALAASAAGIPTLSNERGRGLFLMSIYLGGLRVEVASNGGLRLVGTVQNP